MKTSPVLLSCLAIAIANLVNLSNSQRSPFPSVPKPSGPFYGFPFSPETTIDSLLPFTVEGKCNEGEIFEINEKEDIYKYIYKLECLYYSGTVPEKVPEGVMEGEVVAFLNTKLFNRYLANAWTGKIVNRTSCPGKAEYIGWNNIWNGPRVPFVAYIGKNGANLAPGEWDDGEKHLILEYGVDFLKDCKEYEGELLKVAGRAGVRGTKWIGSAFPVTQVYDVIRLVGKGKDGGDIYFGKTYIKDAYRGDDQAATIGYVILINYDEEANPKGTPGENMLMTKQSFKYMIPGIFDAFLRMIPYDNLLTAPIRTGMTLARRLGRNGLKTAGFAQSLILPSGRRDLQRQAKNFQFRFDDELRTAKEKGRKKKREQKDGNFS